MYAKELAELLLQHPNAEIFVKSEPEANTHYQEEDIAIVFNDCLDLRIKYNSDTEDSIHITTKQAFAKFQNSWKLLNE